MNFFPKKTKFRKIQKGRIKGISAVNTKLTNGTIGLKALEIGRITPSHIESCRQNISRRLKKTPGKLWLNIFPHTPVTSKSVGVRMGKGKGAIDYWASSVRPGQIIIEISGISLILGKDVLLKASRKLPIRTKIVFR